MKKDIHPQYNSGVQVTCTCGNTFATGSTAKEIKVEICSACHPFYTGKQKLVDTAGRVDRFREKVAKAQEMRKATLERLRKKAGSKEVEGQEGSEAESNPEEEPKNQTPNS